MGILVLIAVVISTPARPAWCEQRVRVAIGETADAAPTKNEASTAPGATTEGGGSATGARIVGLVAGPQAVLAEPRPLPEKRRNWVPVITMGAASAVWLGVGIGMTVASNNASADGRAQANAILNVGGGCPDAPPRYQQACSELQTTASRVDTFGRAATVAYTASGVLAIAAATYALWLRSGTKASDKVRALPEVYIGYGGIAVRGAW
ncbi:hypothetical protein WME73_03365 [Sorangium sp. So ce302]|uniref:hypothetical protein n=1 Tax=Sorangium sp. So ce302 TaxID=3133297 RepID=UPI003F5FF2D2